MIKVGVVVGLFIVGGLGVGCASMPPVTEPAGHTSGPTGGGAAATSPTTTPTVAAVATVTPAPTPGAPLSARPTDTIPTLTDQEQQLDAGTYRLDLNNLATGGPDFPAMLITVPDGWVSGGWSLGGPGAGQDHPPVAVLFWDVALVYGHPCQWKGTLLQPGPTVDDLVDALVDVPLRHATDPVAVTLDGYSGKYLQWSVPDDMEVDDDGNFVDCDGIGGIYSFESWTANGWASDRYQQAAGQVDRLWILDVGGPRLVIDAFEMPYATSEEREELTAVVESIRFER